MAFVGRYNYEDLRKAAIKDPTPENLNDLGEWFYLYGIEFWNGECFDADGYSLYPIYSDPDEYGDFKRIGYEFR